MELVKVVCSKCGKDMYIPRETYGYYIDCGMQCKDCSIRHKFDYMRDQTEEGTLA